MTRVDNVCPPPHQQALIGTWRRFGVVGPVYQVLAFDHYLDDGDRMIKIRVLESGGRGRVQAYPSVSRSARDLMFAIAFDLVVAETNRRHPKSVAQAYVDIGSYLGDFGFDSVQGSFYVSNSEDRQSFRGDHGVEGLTSVAAIRA